MSPRFNRTNENIDWACWSWNPVTGCRHGCPYCYARDIAMRFYPEKFEPTFHPERLTAPRDTRPDLNAGTAGRLVFVCSMADLFGAWIPDAWIRAVMIEVRRAPDWTFLFLTKNPSRLPEIQWPENAWAGATIDRQARAIPTLEALARTKAAVRFISAEPLLEPLTLPTTPFEWLILGAQSRTASEPEIQPKTEWLDSLLALARERHIPAFTKSNLDVPGFIPTKEHPPLRIERGLFDAPGVPE